jgi:putative oxidoreductase
MGSALQRLFSMFPNGLPGAGLLLLRLVSSVVIIAGAITTIAAAPPAHTLLWQSIAIPAALLLLVGLWTPIAGLAIAVLELGMALSGTNGVESSVLLATLGAALAALGPGAHSIDAKLYGRKRIQISK